MKSDLDLKQADLNTWGIGNAATHRVVCTVTMASHPAWRPQDPGQRTRGKRHGAFFAAALRSPRDVGTLLPSGPELARRLAVVIPRSGPRDQRPVVVEVGAGAGAVTAAIVDHVDEGTLVIAVEKDPELAEQLRARKLGVHVVTADAVTLPTILADHGVDCADAIVSVLPWALFGPQQQRELLAAFAGALRPDGVFTAAAYSLGYWTPAARRFRCELERFFAQVLPTRTMWRHLPPAMTYVCRFPGQGGDAFTVDPSR